MSRQPGARHLRVVWSAPDAGRAPDLPCAEQRAETVTCTPAPDALVAASTTTRDCIDRLTGYATTLLGWGMAPGDVASAAADLNYERLRPPLPNVLVGNIVESAAARAKRGV
ncbi:hypothetical protein [Capillimicrobium parvum]|uniref:Uncharacterized protein n=1 Tax=Capillimicrobium parvum TaxID=2884022 RepID=A0A9E6XTP0_9ACTN|nr:hypothetical protein [Capillimicrobium parvum]UGS34247.1 hypothetical protein DSM104329_00623 [Capillimicrobium parvum]